MRKSGRQQHYLSWKWSSDTDDWVGWLVHLSRVDHQGIPGKAQQREPDGFGRQLGRPWQNWTGIIHDDLKDAWHQLRRDAGGSRGHEELEKCLPKSPNASTQEAAEDRKSWRSVSQCIEDAWWTKVQDLTSPLPPLGHISEMWRWSGGRGILTELSPCCNIVTITMLYDDTSSSHRSVVNQVWILLGLALPIITVLYVLKLCVTSFTFRVSELSLVRLALDLVDYPLSFSAMTLLIGSFDP